MLLYFLPRHALLGIRLSSETPMAIPCQVDRRPTCVASFAHLVARVGTFRHGADYSASQQGRERVVICLVQRDEQRHRELCHSRGEHPRLYGESTNVFWKRCIHAQLMLAALCEERTSVRSNILRPTLTLTYASDPPGQAIHPTRSNSTYIYARLLHRHCRHIRRHDALW